MCKIRWFTVENHQVKCPFPQKPVRFLDSWLDSRNINRMKIWRYISYGDLSVFFWYISLCSVAVVGQKIHQQIRPMILQRQAALFDLMSNLGQTPLEEKHLARNDGQRVTGWVTHDFFRFFPKNMGKHGELCIYIYKYEHCCYSVWMYCPSVKWNLCPKKWWLKC